MSDFNVNEYWLERGRTYIGEKRTPPEFHRLQERFLLDVLRQGHVPMGRVLEIGCGFGRITKLLAGAWPEADITALDLSPEQLANAQQYCGVNPRVRFEQYDFYSGASLPPGHYDTIVAIEVFLHHPPEFVVELFRKLAASGRHIVNIDWSEDWPGPLPEHVWVHDFAKLYASAELKCAMFPLPEKVDGKQQKLFVAGRDLPEEIIRREQALKSGAATRPTSETSDDWTLRLRLATEELVRLVPSGSSFILVDDGQWGHVRALAGHRVIPFLEKDGKYWGAPADDGTAWRELERLREAGASQLVFAWPSFWWLNHYADFTAKLRSQFPVALENERLLIFKLTP
jgi:SAM-dependent methyltransferase